MLYNPTDQPIKSIDINFHMDFWRVTDSLSTKDKINKL